MDPQRQDLSRELFGRQHLMAPRPGSANPGARAGAEAAAEAAAIAASLGSVGSGLSFGNKQPMRQELVLPPEYAVLVNSDASWFSGTVPAELMSGAPAMPSNTTQQFPQVTQEQMDTSYRFISDPEAPPPLPRLAVSEYGGEVRRGRPTEASTMAYAEPGVFASNVPSRNQSWVAAPMVYDTGFQRPPSPRSNGARALSGRIAAASPAPALVDPRFAQPTTYAMPGSYTAPPFTTMPAVSYTPVPMAQTQATYAPAGGVSYVAHGSLTPRRANDFMQGIGPTSMPQAFERDIYAQTQSLPMTPNSRTRLAGYQPAPTMGSAVVRQSVSPFTARTAMNSYSCPVWPPPPLPPVSFDLLDRLEALEVQKSAMAFERDASNAMREQRLDQLRSEMETAQASSLHCTDLELQLEKCNVEWKLKFEALEARWLEDEVAAARRVEEAKGAAEMRTLEEATRLRGEVQAARREGDQALEDVRSRGQLEIERLRRELQAARDAEQGTRDEAQRRDIEISHLQVTLVQHQDSNLKSVEQLQILEQRTRYSQEELLRERAFAKQRGIEVDDQQHSHEREMSRIASASDDLHLKLSQMTIQRDQLSVDLQHLKDANTQREEECKKLRNSIHIEKDQVRILHAELQTAKVEVSNAALRTQHQVGGNQSVAESIQTSLTTVTSTQAPVVTSSFSGGTTQTTDMRTSQILKLAESSQMFNIDLTEDMHETHEKTNIDSLRTSTR